MITIREAPPGAASAHVEGRRIHVASPRSDANIERSRSVLGGRWDADRQVWSYPATPVCAMNIRRAWSRTFGGPGLVADTPFADLLAKAPNLERANSVKGMGALLPEIPKLNKSAWPHQKEAYWLQRELPGAMLAIGMGGGKSALGVAVAANCGPNGNPAPLTLILCPLSVVTTWAGAAATKLSPRRPGQFEQHTDVPFRVLGLTDGNAKAKRDAAERAMLECRHNGTPLVVVIGYESAIASPLGPIYELRPKMKDGKQVVDEEGQPVLVKTEVDPGWILRQDWDLLVADEAHRLKQASGITSTFVARIQAKKKLLLTGTPMPHDPLDVFAQYRILDPGIFGTSYGAFRDRYAILGGFQNHQIIGWRNLDELNAKFYEWAYRIDDVTLHNQLGLPEVINLPPRVFKLTPKTRRIYDSMNEELIADIGRGTVTAANALVRLIRLAQIADGFVTLDPEDEEAKGKIEIISHEKEDALCDVLADLPVKEPVNIFCRFVPALDAVHRASKKVGRKSLELSGRRKELERWQGGEAADLVVQLKSGGVGVDFTRSAYVIDYDRDWDWGNYSQTRKRNDRPGQTRSTSYLGLVAEDTIDEIIIAAVANRENLITAALRELGRKRK